MNPEQEERLVGAMERLANRHGVAWPKSRTLEALLISLALIYIGVCILQLAK